MNHNENIKNKKFLYGKIKRCSGIAYFKTEIINRLNIIFKKVVKGKLTQISSENVEYSTYKPFLLIKYKVKQLKIFLRLKIDN